MRRLMKWGPAVFLVPALGAWISGQWLCLGFHYHADCLGLDASPSMGGVGLAWWRTAPLWSRHCWQTSSPDPMPMFIADRPSRTYLFPPVGISRGAAGEIYDWNIFIPHWLIVGILLVFIVVGLWIDRRRPHGKRGFAVQT